MAEPVDLDNLTGQSLLDQDGRKIGDVTGVCDSDAEPMWVTVDASFSLSKKRTVLVPVARLKEERGKILVPYSIHHMEGTPEVDAGDGLSAEDDRLLRDHFGIDRADQELLTDNDSYAARVQEGPGTPRPEAFEPDED